MKTIPSLSPIHTDNRKVPGIGSAIESITQDISECLSKERRKILKEKNETFAELLGQLQDEIERKREKINYDYSFEDYKKRLSQSDEVLQRVFEEKVLGIFHSTNIKYLLQKVFRKQPLGDEKIKTLYDALLGSIENETAKEVLKQKLWEEYFEDLVYESMEKGDYKMQGEGIDLSNNYLSEFDEKYLQIVIKNLKNVKSIDLCNMNLVISEANKLNLIFENLGNVKDISLSWNNLAELDEPKLRIIFEKLKNIKSIDLGYNSLAELDEDKLQIIFENLRNVKSIDLSGCDLSELDENKLQIIFENLRNIKSINLHHTNLNKLDEKQLQVIFENLRNVKSINLSRNNLLNLDEKRGRIIFENLRNVKSVILWGNILSKLDEPQLQIIFENLVKAEEIHVSESPEFVEKIVSKFPDLKDKIINQY